MLEWSHNGSTEQALLACVMKGNYKPLETKWNVLPSIEKIPQDSRVLHFFGTRKPWTHPNVRGIELWIKEQTSWDELRKGI
jgi:lipopolysaccharide biosynthesis glycosyltransferase